MTVFESKIEFYFLAPLQGHVKERSIRIEKGIGCKKTKENRTRESIKER